MMVVWYGMVMLVVAAMEISDNNDRGGDYDMIIMVVLMIVGDGMMVMVMTTMKK